ncbi:TMV resistance protein N-like isoform X2 [Castanea sativa]|uniref:TMV resistance protein N-like isoform X2 n=1 Tax=Castanea sativa TaxID=21020 RepID=UPI003F64C956
MASMSTQKACTSSSSSLSSSSSSKTQWKYDVFLSFYGLDTRKNFTDHLYATLKQKGINTYRDNENLEEGEPIASGLMKAIEESQYAIIILSKYYAFSKWCLKELVKILECRKEKEMIVRPIFYHVKPSDVGNQRETFGEAFVKHEKDPKVSTEQMREWRTALEEVSKIRGRHLLDSHESEDIQDITKSIFDELSCESSDDSEHLVGINSRVEEMMNLFSTMSDDVHFIGIWGMPGIGKTTLAYAIYNKICHDFEASSFVCDIRKTVEKDKQGLVNLQKQLLSETLMVKEVNIWSYLEGIKVIGKRLLNKKVLIVLDDVDKDEQLKALAGSPSWFGQGSRIIITSEDKHLLKKHHLGTTIHRVNELDNNEALELFSWIVFNQPYPKKEFEDLSNGFVKYAKGLPIALKVHGSSLIDRPRKVWEDYLHQLEETYKGEILDELEISYRGLNEIQQNLFLDIACFFKGEDENRVANIEGVGSSNNMKTLIDKSLITISEGKLQMHDLVEKMAWRVVHRESPKKPGRRSRLWFCKDVFHVLKENTGTKFVEGMVLNSPPHEENLNDKAFSNMINLSFQPDNLVELIMPRSHIKQLPEGFGNLAKLRLMDLSDSQNLVKTPNFIGCPDLQRLIFRGCTRLHDLPRKLNLESLQIFILSGCVRLKKFSEIGTNMTKLSELYLDGTALEELPLSIANLTGLTLLSLQDCKNISCSTSVNLPSLKTLNLSGCKGQQSNFWYSHGIFQMFRLTLGIDYFFPAPCPELDSINLPLPMLFGLSSLVSLDLSDCNLSDGTLPDDLSCFSLLEVLKLNKNNFTSLPDSISQLSKLTCLHLENCTQLQSLPNLPLSVSVNVRGCTSLEYYSDKVVQWNLPQ